MTLTPQQIQEFIPLAKAVSDYWATSDSDSVTAYGDDDHLAEIAKFEESDICRGFKGFLRSLSDEEFRELKVVMSIGRGDFPASEFLQAYEQTSLESDREQDIDYMIEKMQQHDYFADGFERLNIARII